MTKIIIPDRMGPLESSQKCLGAPITELWRNSDITGSQARDIYQNKTSSTLETLKPILFSS